MNIKPVKQARKIIKLNEDYGLSADDLNLILMHRKVNQDKDSVNYGKESYSNIGYYSNIESFLKNLVNKRILLEVQENDTLEALVSSIERYVSLMYADVAQWLKSLKRWFNMKDISVRSIVKFVSKHKDDSLLIVKELVLGNRVKVQSLKTGEYYIVPVTDVYLTNKGVVE